MRIDGSKVGNVGDPRKDKVQPPGATSGPIGGHGAVVVSARAQKLAASAGGHNEERSRRIADIKAEVDGGTYKVDHQKLAEKLVDEEIARGAK